MEPIKIDKNNILPPEWGTGWLTNNANDLCRIMIVFGNVPMPELVLTIHRIHKGTGKVNTATVERAFVEMRKQEPQP